MKYKIGEIVAVLSPNGLWDGWREVEVLGYRANWYNNPLLVVNPTHWPHINNGDAYIIRCPDGVRRPTSEPYMRKRPPEERDYIPESIRDLFKREVTA